MSYAYRAGDAWIEITGPFILGDGVHEVQYPASWPDLVGAADRAHLGIVEVEEADPQPQDRLVTGSALIDDAGRPKRVWTTQAYTLGAAIDLCWNRAKAYRDQQANGGCDTPLGRVDTDAESQRKINGASTAALVAQVSGEPFPPIAWTMADNSVVEHDVAQVITMGMTVVGHINACQQAGNAIRALIYAAEAPEDAFGVDRTAGYP